MKRRGKVSLEEAREELELGDVEQRGVAHPGELAVLRLELREIPRGCSQGGNGKGL